MAKLEINIQIRKSLKPSTPTPNHLRILNLSLLDQHTRHVYSAMLFYYRPSSNAEWNRSERVCDQLQKSLAETLAGRFYPLAGRFRKDDMSIHCNDQGVEYVETKVNADVAEFVHAALGPNNIELLDDLLAWSVPPEVDLPSSPLLGVQVNLFNCGGVVIAVQTSHLLADGFTVGTFVNEWAHISLTGTTPGNGPSYGHLASLFPARIASPPSPSNKEVDVKIVTKVFVFDALSIAKLKNRIDGSTNAVTPSRVVLVMSLIWKVLVGISRSKQRSRDPSLLFTMNMRGKSIIPSSENALGNFCSGGIATLEPNQSRKEEFRDLVNLVTTTSRATSELIGKASIDVITSMFVNSGGTRPWEREDIYICSSLSKFPLYEVDFGWGKPFWVSLIGVPREEIVLMDTKNGDGIEVWVSLKENDMAEFEKHPEITSSFFARLRSSL